MMIGIVGKPSCGKSTFFKASTLADVDIANYPFTTIEANKAVGFVKIKDPAREFGKVSNPRAGYVEGEWRFVPVELIDVAGLVPGAHKGEGMGSQFLNDLNQADALIHVIDVSGSVNEKGEPVPALSYDPANDISFLEDELDHWYLGIMKKGWEKFARQVSQEHKDINKALGKQLSGLGVDEDIVKEAVKKLGLNPDNPSSWSDDQLFSLARELRIKTKPMLIAANKIDVPGAEKNFERLKKEFPHLMIIPTSAATELALREANKKGFIKYIPGSSSFEILSEDELSEAQKKGLEFMRTFLEKFKSTGVQETLNKAVFDLLKYKPIFPGGVGKLEDSDGNTLPDCFLMPAGATALDFAYKLHTDFGKNFVKAINVRTKMPMAKDHVLEFGDIVEIMASK